jgi:hypothetical protein
MYQKYLELKKQEEEKKKRKKRETKEKRKQQKIKENYFLLQRTGLEMCHLEWPANFSTMLFSPRTCATLFKMTFIH